MRTALVSRMRRTGPLLNLTADIARNLNLHDVVYVQVKGRRMAAEGSVQARLRVRPSVQGAALVLENRTGRILAMAGSFSLPLEPAQPHLADRASARLNDQTGYLSYGTAKGAAAQHLGVGRTDDVAADRRRASRHDETGAISGFRATPIVAL